MFDGGRMRKIRQEQHITQELLSERLNIHVNTIRRWEQDKQYPDANKLSRLASALNTTVAYLTGETDEPERSAPTETDEKKPEAAPAVPKGKEGTWNRGELYYRFPNGGELRLPDTPENKGLFEKLITQGLSAGKI